MTAAAEQSQLGVGAHGDPWDNSPSLSGSELPTPRIINLLTDPKEREPYNAVYGHTWTLAHFSRLLGEFKESVQREPLIPAGSPLDHVPKA